jgi:ABC-type multidrug transport system fused ATPase/permease subunit
MAQVILFALVFSNFMSSGVLGVALANSVMIPIMMQHTINLTAIAEVQLNSVERLRHYAQGLPRERYAPEAIEDGPSKPAPAQTEGDSKRVEGEKAAGVELALGDRSWPSEGRIVFDSVSCRYRDGPLVLKTISFSTRPAEKVR